MSYFPLRFACILIFFFLPPFHRNVCIQTWRFPPWAYQISTCSCNATGLHSIQLWKQFLNTALLTSPHLLYSTWHFHGHLWKETLWPWRKPRWRLKENEPSEGYSSAVQGRLFKWHHEARAQRRRSPLAQAVITGIRCFVVWMSLGERFALLVMAFEEGSNWCWEAAGGIKTHFCDIGPTGDNCCHPGNLCRLKLRLCWRVMLSRSQREPHANGLSGQPGISMLLCASYTSLYFLQGINTFRLFFS